MRFDEIDNYNPATAHLEEIQESYDEPLDEVLDDLEESSADELDLSDMSDVELRLEEANCFKALLNNSLFADTNNPIANKVEQKVRKYIKEELKVLLGLSQTLPITIKEKEVYRSPFSSDEEKVLKGLAAKVLAKESKPEIPAVAKAEIKALPETPAIKPTTVAPIRPIPNKAKSEPIKAPHPEEPKKTRGRKKVAPKVEPKEVKKEEPDEMVEITAPNGQVIRVKKPKNTAQVVDTNAPGFKPMPSPEAIANMVQHQAAVNIPLQGLVGKLVNAAHTGNLQYVNDNNDGDE